MLNKNGEKTEVKSMKSRARYLTKQELFQMQFHSLMGSKTDHAMKSASIYIFPKQIFLFKICY